MSLFKKASKKQSKLRLLLQGPSGSGKTWSALTLAQVLGKKVAVVDTEKGSASLYSDQFQFDVLELPAGYHTPEHYIKSIKEAENEGYDVLILDSISHEWQACLDLVTKIGNDSFKGNSFSAWSKVTPRHDAFVNAVLASSMHIIATTRAKQEYVMQEKNGKQVPVKVGLAGVQRDGLDYEFTIVFELNQSHIANATKDRSRLFDGKDFLITEDTGKELLNWLNSGPDDETEKVDPETDVQTAPVEANTEQLKESTENAETLSDDEKQLAQKEIAAQAAEISDTAQTTEETVEPTAETEPEAVYPQKKAKYTFRG